MKRKENLFSDPEAAMSLSKIYKSSETFKPDDIVQETFKDESPWKKLIHPPAETETGNTVQHRSPRQEEEVEPPRPDQPSAPDMNDPEGENQLQQPSPQDRVEAGLEPGIPVAEVEKIAAEAHEQGVLDGLKKAEEDFGSATKSMLLACSQLDELREVILKNSIGEIQELVLAIAEKIIRHSVKEQKETILRTVDEAIGKAVKSEELSVFVNPDDYDTIADKSGELMPTLSGLSNIVVKTDGSVEPGGCRIESDNCTVDASLISQMEIISDWVKEQK